MSLPVSLPTDQPDPRGIHLDDGTPLAEALLRVPNGHLLVYLIPPPQYGPPKVPEWGAQFNLQSGSCKLVVAVLPEEPPPGFPFRPNDLMLFEGRRLTRVTHDAYAIELNAVAEFVFDLGSPNVKSLIYFERPAPDGADGGGG